MTGGWPLWHFPYIVGGMLAAGWVIVRESLSYLRKRKKPPRPKAGGPTA